ncbi:alpha/beta fold hydrolase [Tahibacter sp.]|uniref:thioesterase II family protein n=1 Tax=Tahibacter sp. TaxID=2056211 RepID=UPI0028C47215|nr:alpha/beta fold hydrolase [Tahibacter sp.]
MKPCKNFVKLNAALAPRKIVVFPYAGGSPYAFRDWGPLLEPQHELWSLQLPGRAGRFGEPCLDDMDAVVDAVMTELPALVAGAQFSFFGHSNGALVAYACTQRLERVGAQLPRHVFLSGQKAPNGPPRRDSELSDPELVRFLTVLGGMPQEVAANEELLGLYLPIIRADMKIGESFRPHDRLRLATPVSVLGGTQDNETTRETLDGWREFCYSVQRVELLPGDHFFLTPHRDYIVDLVKGSLVG